MWRIVVSFTYAALPDQVETNKPQPSATQAPLPPTLPAIQPAHPHRHPTTSLVAVAVIDDARNSAQC